MAFAVHSSSPFRACFGRLVLLSSLAASSLFLASCGQQVHAIVGPTAPISPSTQPQIYGLVVSADTVNPCGAAGLGSVLDVSGDAILPVVGVGPNPVYAAVSATGLQAFSVSQFQGTCGDSTSPVDGSVSVFALSTNITTVANVTTTSLPTGSAPTHAFYSGSQFFLSEPGRTDLSPGGAISILVTNGSTGGLAEVEELPSDAPVIGFAGDTGGPRVYAIEPNANEIQAIDLTTSGTGGTTSTNSLTATIPVGTNPVAGVMSPDGRRAFIANEGSNTVSAIDAQGNDLIMNIPVGQAPVALDYYNSGSVLVVANSGNSAVCAGAAAGSAPGCGTVTILDADETSSNFGGRLVATDPIVGPSPSAVVVNQDGTRAYIANSGAQSISIVNLKNGSVSTIALTGYPFFLAISNSTTQAKVFALTYASAPVAGQPAPTANSVVTIIRTQANGTGAQDQIESQLSVEGVPSWVALPPSR